MMRIVKYSALLITLACFLAGCASTSNRDLIAVTELKKAETLGGDYLALQGRWTVTHNELKRNVLSKMHGSVFVFRDNEFFVQGDTGTEFYRLREDLTPKHIDFISGNSVIRGIYELNGDQLTLCTAAPGDKRPTAFRTSILRGDILTRVKRKN